MVYISIGSKLSSMLFPLKEMDKVMELFIGGSVINETYPIHFDKGWVNLFIFLLMELPESEENILSRWIINRPGVAGAFLQTAL